MGNQVGELVHIPWSVSFEVVTPELAASWLQKNSINRRLRPGVVRRYALTMKAGKWVTSPEAICFDADGVVLNGQHRLEGVVASGASVVLMIVRGVPRSVFEVFDRGSPRSYADSIGIDRRLAEVARLAAYVCATKANSVPDFAVKHMAEMLGESHESLLSHCNARSNVVSAAPVRLAACLRMMTGNENFVLQQYRALCLGHVHDLCRSAQSFLGAVAIGRVKAGGGTVQRELLVRAWDVFDESKKNNSRIQIRDAERRISEIRDVIGWSDDQFSPHQ